MVQPYLAPRAAEDRVGGYWEGEARAGNASPIMVFIGIVLGKRRALRTKTSRNIAEKQRYSIFVTNPPNRLQLVERQGFQHSSFETVAS